MDLRNLMTRFAYGLPAGSDAAALEEAGWKLLGGVTRSEGAYTGSLFKLNAWLIRNEVWTRCIPHLGKGKRGRQEGRRTEVPTSDGQGRKHA
eukprot:226039-Chlamydomonas_euryale.AAC.1